MTVFLASATFIEKFYGSEFIRQHFYNAWWFIILWSIIITLTLLTCCKKPFYKHLKNFLFHFSFVLIFVGALTTFLTSRNGKIHLRDDGSIVSKTIDLPFEIKLDTFYIDYYKATNSPANYVSKINLVDNNKIVNTTISVNNIFKYKGFRFYQSSYDKDFKGSVLIVKYDRYGTTIVYLGYILLLFSVLWILLSKKGVFRRAIKILGIVLLFLLPVFVSAQQTFTQEESELFGRLSILYRGRITPIDTYARDFVKKISGKTTYKNFNSVQVLAGCFFFPEEWQKEPLIKIKSKKFKSLLNIEDKACFTDFFENDKSYKLLKTANDKDFVKTDEIVNVILALQSGQTMKIFPNNGQWFSSESSLTAANPKDTLFISKILLLVQESIKNNNHEQTTFLLDKIGVFQKSRDTQNTISSFKNTLEIYYNRFNIISILFKLNLFSGVFALGFELWNTRKNSYLKRIRTIYCIPIAFTFIYLTILIAIRWMISNHIPMSNGYETMIFISWFISLISLVFSKKSELLSSIGLLLSGCTLLVASIGVANPQITQLVPALMSTWLSIHVSLFIISYSLLGFITINSLIYIILHISFKTKQVILEKLFNLNIVLLYPALFCIVAGIITGSVWANETWGRYWAWDPKEVWALITLLVYSFSIHQKSLSLFRNKLFFHCYLIISFLCILITYFGVTYFFGGLHSY